MKHLLCIILAFVPSCESFNKLTPEQQARILDRGLIIVDAVTNRVVGKINPASGVMAKPSK
jgi:hypothetical protein